MKAHIRLLASTNAPSHRPCRRRAVLAVGIAALLLPFFGVDDVHAATLDLNGVNITLPNAPDFTTSYLSGANNVTDFGASATLFEGGGPAAPIAYTGMISDGSGVVSLVHTGGTTIIHGTTNNYSGGTTIDSGLISFNNGGTLGASNIDLNGGGLLSTATLTLSDTVVFNTGTTDTVSAVTGTVLSLPTLDLEGVSDAVFGSTGHTGVIVIGPGTSGDFASNGAAIDVAFGTLRNGGALGFFTASVASTTVHAGATLDVHDSSMEVANLLGAGTVTLGTSAATVLTVDAGSFSGVISGAGQLAKTTTGTLILTGTNTFTGGSFIGAGTLQIGNGGTTGSITGKVTDKDTLAFDRSNAVTFGGIISGTGALTQAGTGVLTLTGVNTYSGNTTLNAGVVSINNASALGSGSVTLNNGSGLLTTANLALANPVIFNTGETGVVAAASGTTLTLDAVQLFGHAVFGSAGHTGVVTLGPINAGSFVNLTGTSMEVAFGTLRNDDTSLSFYGRVVSTTVDAGAALDVHDFNAEIANLQGAGTVTLGTNAATVLTVDAGSFSGVISGAGELAKTNTGTLILTGANTFTGGSFIGVGTLQIGNGGTTGSITGKVTDKDTLSFDRSNAVTFGGIISGTGGLTQAGTGVLTLTGVNTYSGNTTVNAGVVSINNASALGSGSVTLNNGSGLLTTANLALANPVIFNMGETGVVAAASGTTLTLDAVQLFGHAVFGSASHTGVVTLGPINASSFLSQTSTIMEVAFGTLRNDDNSFNIYGRVASTTVDAGATLDVHDFNAEIANLQGAGAVTLGTNAATFLSADAGNFSGVISGAGQLTKATTGTFILSGTNTYTGGTTIKVGTLQIGKGGSTGSITGNIVDNDTLIFDRSNVLTFAGKISGAGSVTQNGTGVLTLTGMNSYIGGTTINAGVVSINNSSALGTGTVTLNNGGALLTTANLSLGNEVLFNTAVNATVSAAAGTTLTLDSVGIGDVNAAPGIFGSPGHTGVVDIALGSGRWNTGSTLEVAFGTLRNGGALGFFTNALASTTVDAGATMDVHDFNMTVANLQGAGTVTLGTSAATILTVDAGNFGGVISGAGQLTKATTGTFILSGTNTYTGGTTINAGNLQIGNGSTGSIAGNIVDNGSLTVDRSTALTIAGNISGSGTLTQVGSGVLTLTGLNSYAGGTTINAGVVSFNSGSPFGPGTVTLNNAGSLLATANVTLGNEVLFNTSVSGTVSAAPGSTLTLFSLGIGDVDSVQGIFGSPGHTGVVNIVPGATALNPGSSIVVAFGTLRNGGGLAFFTNALASTTVDAGAKLDVHDNSMTVANLQGAGTVTLGTSAATILTVDAGTFSGVISGAGQLTKASSNTLILTGANTYTGGTTINAGNLQIGNGGTTGSITGNIIDNATLIFDRSNALTFAGKISGTGSLSQAGTGVLTLTGANTYSGGTTVNTGVVSINNASALGTGSVTLNNGSSLLTTANLTLANTVVISTGATTSVTAASGTTLTPDALQLNGNVVFGSTGRTGVVVIGPLGGSASVSGTGTSIEVAFGTLRDSGGNLGFYTGRVASTKVDAGATLDLHDSSNEVANLLGAGAVTLGTNAATVLTVDAGNFSGIIGGAGKLLKPTTGTLILTSANTYTGGTTITGGTMQLGNGGTTGSITGNVTDSADLTFDHSNALTFAGKISGTGGVTQAGTGVLTLTGANTYSGGTTVNASAVSINNSSALGTGSVTLDNSGGLLTTANLTLAVPVAFSSTSTGVISATAGTTLNLDSIQLSSFSHVVFGSTGHTGVVDLGPSTANDTESPSDEIEVAFGTLRNGGALGFFTNALAATTVDAGAMLDVHDSSMEVANLQGAGAVTLGTSAATVLTLDGGSFGGVISGAGHVTKATANSFVLTKANTYTGGTTVSAGTLLVNNTSGSATGTGPVTINSTATLGGSGTIAGAMTLNSGGFIEPGIVSVGAAGTKLHGSSLLWNGGGTLTLQLGATSDELILSGALTKGTTGTFTLNLVDDNITATSYTLATFASTNFTLSDFNISFVGGGGGTLTETSTSLVLTMAHNEEPAGGATAPPTPLPGDLDQLRADTASPADATTTSSDLSSSLSITPTPEPTSVALLAFAGAALLGWRRRHVVRPSSGRARISGAR